MKSSHFLSEGFVEDANDVHADHEVQMARADCFHAAEDALALHKLLRHIDEHQGIEGWVAAKITLAADYLKTVREHLEYQMMSAQPVAPEGGELAIAEDQGVAEGSSDTVYPNAEVIKSKNGKPVGEIYQDGNSWGCFHYKADRGYDLIDSREDAIEALKDLHQETGRSRPDYTIKGEVSEQGIAEAGFTKTPSGDYIKQHTGVRSSKPPVKKKRGEKTGAEWDAIEKAKKDKDQGVAEGTGNIGNAIKALYQKIYNAGDDEIEYFYYESPVFALYWDKYEGDINSIVAEVDPKELQIIHDELESYVDDANLAEGDELGGGYAEDLARQVFKHNPNLDNEEKILNIGYSIAKSDLGSRAQGIFRDEDFPSDFVSAYNWLKRRASQTVSEMSAGSVATVVNPTPKNKAKVGSLFGGTYKQKSTKAK